MYDLWIRTATHSFAQEPFLNVRTVTIRRLFTKRRKKRVQVKNESHMGMFGCAGHLSKLTMPTTMRATEKR